MSPRTDGAIPRGPLPEAPSHLTPSQKINGPARAQPEARPLDHQTMKDKRIMPNPVGLQPRSSLNYFRVAVTCDGSKTKSLQFHDCAGVTP